MIFNLPLASKARKTMQRLKVSATRAGKLNGNIIHASANLRFPGNQKPLVS
jgi:hypothetical protein